MHSVYMTHNPCVYNPSLHVCTQCTEPSQCGWRPSERWDCSRKVWFTYTVLWNKPGLASVTAVGRGKEGRMVWSWQVNWRRCSHG